MPASVITSVIAFISTNIDDIFVLMILFANASTRLLKMQTVIGQFLGIGILTLFSILGAFGLQFLSAKYAAILGLIPIFLGIRAWIDREQTDDAETIPSKGHTSRIISVAMITLANGADNIGVYIPLFTGYSSIELFGTILIFAAMTALWCRMANSLAELPKIKTFLNKYKDYIIPLVFILLGIYIILEHTFFP